MRVHNLSSMILAVAVVCYAVVAQATVTIDLVPVGNPGNDGELSGSGAGGYGSDRICGAVGYTYNIGKYEVTAGQYCEFLNAVGKTDRYELYDYYMNYDTYPEYKGCNIKRSGVWGSYTYNVASDWANRPVNFVSWGDIARFVNWLQNEQPVGTLTGIPSQDGWLTEDGTYYLNGAISITTLMAVTRKPGMKWWIPNEDEWYKAAYHKNDGVTGNYWDYPTGTNLVPGHDMSEATNPGNNSNFHGSPYPIDSGMYFTTVKGEFQLSDSPYGTFDQGGNVMEWNETVMSSSFRGLRGGSFLDGTNEQLASGRAMWTPTTQYYDVGFRVASVPEPCSLIMLAGLALTALLYWWRKRA